MDEEQFNGSAQAGTVASRPSIAETIDEAELASLPILKPGAQLEAGGVYVDLNSHEPAPFKALEGQVAGTGNRYIARRDVSHELWNRLVERSYPIDAESHADRQDVPGDSLGSFYERGEHGSGSGQ